MSKAFTNEDSVNEDDFEDEDDFTLQVPGGKNYITPWGAQRLRDEFKQLLDVDALAAAEVTCHLSGDLRFQNQTAGRNRTQRPRQFVHAQAICSCSTVDYNSAPADAGIQPRSYRSCSQRCIEKSLVSVSSLRQIS